LASDDEFVIAGLLLLLYILTIVKHLTGFLIHGRITSVTVWHKNCILANLLKSKDAKLWI